MILPMMPEEAKKKHCVTKNSTCLGENCMAWSSRQFDGRGWCAMLAELRKTVKYFTCCNTCEGVDHDAIYCKTCLGGDEYEKAEPDENDALLRGDICRDCRSKRVMAGYVVCPKCHKTRMAERYLNNLTKTFNMD